MQHEHKQSELYNNARAALDAVVDDYLKTGIAKLRADNFFNRGGNALSPHNSFRGFLRQMAKENKRPFIYVEDFMQRNGTVVHTGLALPRLKKIAHSLPLLTLTAVEQTTGYGHYNESRPVSVYNGVKTKHLFYFKGEEGEHVLQGWLEYMRTNPTCRLALGLSAAP